MRTSCLVLKGDCGGESRVEIIVERPKHYLDRVVVQVTITLIRVCPMRLLDRSSGGVSGLAACWK